jgi:hypothetical protein
MTGPSLSTLVEQRYGASATHGREPALRDAHDVFRTLLGHRSVSLPCRSPYSGSASDGRGENRRS